LQRVNETCAKPVRHRKLNYTDCPIARRRYCPRITTVFPYAMNTAHRKRLPGTQLDFFDTRAAVDAIEPGAYDKLPYTSRVLAENLVRRCDPEMLTASLKQIIERKRELDFCTVT